MKEEENNKRSIYFFLICMDLWLEKDWSFNSSLDKLAFLSRTNDWNPNKDTIY